MSDRRSSECVDPHEHVRDEMACRGLTDAEMPACVRLWLDGDTSMSMTVQQTLAAMWGTSVAFWRNLESSWQRWKEQRDE